MPLLKKLDLRISADLSQYRQMQLRPLLLPTSITGLTINHVVPMRWRGVRDEPLKRLSLVYDSGVLTAEPPRWLWTPALQPTKEDDVRLQIWYSVQDFKCTFEHRPLSNSIPPTQSEGEVMLEHCRNLLWAWTVGRATMSDSVELEVPPEVGVSFDPDD